MDKFICILSALFLMALQVILSKHYHNCPMCCQVGGRKSTTNIMESIEADWPLATFQFHHVMNLCSANKNLAPTLSSLQFSSNILRLSSIHNTMYKWNNSFASTQGLPAFWSRGIYAINLIVQMVQPFVDLALHHLTPRPWWLKEWQR